jgi:poly(A) polymerase
LTDRDQVDAAERLVAVINDLDRTDDLGPYQSPLSGSDIMAELNLAPGPIVGQAQAFLRERRLTDGPITADEARRLLRRWYDDETGGASLP